jgi:hypothetical protein
MVAPFTVFTGPRVSGWKEPGRVRAVTGGDDVMSVDNHPALARALVSGLGARDFDVAFVEEPEEKDAGFDHAFVPPLRYLVPEATLPVVPLMVNCYYPTRRSAPGSPSARCPEEAPEEWRAGSPSWRSW